MFTMKKLALVGVAGLAAFSMSCSDSDTEEAAGIWKTEFNVTSGTTIVLTGVIEANEGNEVTGVGITASGTAAKISDEATLKGPTVDLAGRTVTQVCGTKKGEQTFDFVITVTFDDQSKLTAEKKGVKVDCGESVSALTGIVLSNTGDSYLDADEGKTYKSAAAKQRASEIDLIAYHNGTAGDKIYTCAVDLEGCDELNAIIVAGVPQNIDDVEEFYYSDDYEEVAVASVAISVGKVFIVETDKSTFAVEITGKEDQAVSLKLQEI